MVNKQTNDDPRRESADNLTTNFPHSTSVSAKNRPYIHGKFIFAGDEKLYLRGVTYGTFAPTQENSSEYDPVNVARDFALMTENGINTVRVYTVPPLWLLDEAQRCGLRVMVGLPWEQHVAFLDNRKTVKSIEERIRGRVLHNLYWTSNFNILTSPNYLTTIQMKPLCRIQQPQI